MGLKQDVIAAIIAREGRYSNDANDRGGETAWGVTIAEARANGYAGPMMEMPREVAERIYAAKYWDKLRLDDVAALSEIVAGELADIGVNMGTGTAAIFLQRILNVFNRRGEYYPDLSVDGGIGPATLSALRQFLIRRNLDGDDVLKVGLNCLQGARYIELAERDPKQEDFVYGWILNRAMPF